MIAPEFLDGEVVGILHGKLVRAFGGPTGFNDENLFRSALYRPVDRWQYAETPKPDLLTSQRHTPSASSKIMDSATATSG